MRVPKSIRSTAVLLASVVALTGVSVTVLAASNASPADLERGGSISFQAGGTGPSFPEGTVIEDQIYETRVTIPDLQLPRATGGSEPLTYTIAPPLPSGLVFDPTNLTITNRSTSDHDETNYTYTVTDGDDATASLTFTIEVEDYEPSVPSFGDQDIENQTYSLGRPITALQLPAVVKREGEDRLSGNGKITYGITTMAPATDLPNGLSFDPGTLQITGTPAETNSPGTTVHTYTASDGDSVTGAADEASITFSITLETDTSPSFGTATIADQEHKFGTAFSGLPLPAATGGNGDIKYEFDPPLPDGLTLAVTEGTPTISGTPTVSATNERDYTYTAKDRDGDSASLTFSIRLINPLDTAHISKIGPAVRSVAVSPGETVVLRTHLYGLQGEVDADLDTDAVAFAWSYAAAGSNDSNAISGNDAAVPFTVPSSPGTYTAKATLIADHCTSTTPNEWKASDCTAEFEVVVKRPSASAAEDEAPVNPPASAIPSILTDSDGNQYEVFTPEQGGTFAGEGYWVQAHPGAVPNGEVIGIRMAVGGPADNSEMTAHRYTLGGSTYEIAAVDADGASVNGYVLEPNGLEVCVPLPDHLRGNVADASVVAHADDSLAILTSTVRINADGLLVCGTLSHLPATVAAGIEGSPKAPEAADDPTTPATGGAAPASGTPLLLLALGVLVGVIGVASIVAARRRRTVVGEFRG